MSGTEGRKKKPETYLPNWLGFVVYISIFFGVLSRYELKLSDMAHAHRPTTADIAQFYNTFGSYFINDRTRALFETNALSHLLDHCDFHPGQTVVEIGPGTGALAENILAQISHTDGHVVYYGVEVSQEMAKKTTARISKYIEKGQAVVETVESSSDYIEFLNTPVDRFIVAYVFDLMDAKTIAQTLALFKNKMRDDGSSKVCVVNLTHGYNPITRIFTNLWQMMAYIVGDYNVGGCRPIETLSYFTAETGFVVDFSEKTSNLGLPSQVVVAHAVTTTK